MSAFGRFLDRVIGGGNPAPAPAPPKPKPAPKPTPKPAPKPAPRPFATFDSADEGDPYNRKHWLSADDLSADAAASPEVRRVLRRRSRYERANNGYCKGLIRGRTNDTVGTGPRLQLDLPDQDPDFQRAVPPEAASDLARRVEARWREWVEATGFNDDLRLLADCEDGDGEGFALLATNPALPVPVKLDLRVVEADRVATPEYGGWFYGTGKLGSNRLEEPLGTYRSVPAAEPPRNSADGIEFDESGNPTFYHVLDRHPGDDPWGPAGSYARVPASQVVHLFERLRPGQSRGLPLVTHALNLYAVLRRYKYSHLKAAELGAKVAGVIENPNAPVPSVLLDEKGDFSGMDQIPFPDNVLLNLAGGQTAKSFEGKDPPVGYDEYVHSNLTEIGMGCAVARNRATGSSAEYNYSSARLDHLPGRLDVRVRRERFERVALDPVFRAWLAEALLVPDYLPPGLPPADSWEWSWHWDAFESIDPEKDARAVEVEKANGHVTDAEVWARKGKNWREQYRQLALEKRERERLGLESAPAPPPAAFEPEPEPEPGDEEEVADEA